MSDWCIKLPGHLKPIIEEQARADYVPAPDYVRQLVQRVVFEKQIAQSRQHHQNSE
jgi:hypothetical protein